jgi:hypothetical protein
MRNAGLEREIQMTHARMWVGIVVVVGLLGALVLSRGQERAVGVASADAAVQKVKCNEGQTLTEALQKAKDLSQNKFSNFTFPMTGYALGSIV